MDIGSICIDAHHHLWRYRAPGPSWMVDGMESLRRDFLVDDLRSVASDWGITGTIVVETERTVEETEWLSQLAALNDLVCGVVGWAPLTNSNIVSELERLAALPKLKGVRHAIQDEMDDYFILRDDFNRGIAALKQFDLRYDLLIFEKHLPQTIEFVDRHPDQVFVLDHVAKPRIRDRILSPWKKNLCELGRRLNVYCKVSGIVTEAAWQTWSDEQISPYIDAALEAFGPKRLMFGSDWPVVTLASSYGRWVNALCAATSKISATEREWIFSKTAIQAYRL
jgi:L-fuconolactonase